MSNAVYPVLPGLTYPVKKMPIFKTMMQEAVSGRESRIALMSYPKWQFDLQYSVLRSGVVHSAGTSWNEQQQLIDFFLQRLGDFDNFLFDDREDDSVTDSQFGIGNAVATQFQLTRAIQANGFLEPVMNVNALTNIKKNGVVQNNPADYSINSTGLVTFTSAPGNGVSLTWTGTYYFRCRFAQSMQEFQQFMRKLWSGQIQLIGSLGVKV